MTILTSLLVASTREFAIDLVSEPRGETRRQ